MVAETIKTEVDRLVILINEEEEISMADAAKKLNMPLSTIEEWSNFLLEEKLIDIQYKFTKPLLVKRKLTQKEAEDIKSGLKDEKNVFDKKSEVLLIYLDKLESEVSSLKDILKDLDKNFNKRFSEVKKELKNLHKAEEDKDQLNKNIIESKQKFMKKIADVNKSILKEQADYKMVYDFMYNQSQMEGQILNIQDDELELIKETDKILNQKLKDLKKKIDEKKLKKIKDKDKIEDETESNIHLLEKKYKQVSEFLDAERKIMEELVKENQGEEEQIELLKQGVLDKIKTSNAKADKTLGEIKDFPKRVSTFMSKKDKVIKILNGIAYNERMLREKIIDLRKKSAALNIQYDSADAVVEIKELEKDLQEIAKKRSFFESEIKKIFTLLKL